MLSETTSQVGVIHVVRPLTVAEKNGGAEIAVKVKTEGDGRTDNLAQYI